MDIEREPLLSVSNDENRSVDMSAKGPLNEDHIDLHVGEKTDSRRTSRGLRMLSQALKAIVVLLVAFLAVNGFWALVRPELFRHKGLVSLHKGRHGHHGHHHHHHHHHHHDHHGRPGHGPDHPPPHDPPHGPPHGPPHRPPGHDHPFPPPPPPHKPGHGPGDGRPGPPTPPPPPPHQPHPHPPPPPPKGPGKVQKCFDLHPGKTIELSAKLEWPGQSVRITPSLAGSSATFVWDGMVGPPAPPGRGPHRGPPRPPAKGTEPEKGALKEHKDDKRKHLGDARYSIDVPSKAEWKKIDINPRDLKLCSVLRFGSIDLEIFNSSGVPPSRAHIDPSFEHIVPQFNITVHLPDSFARTPISAGHFP